MTRNALALIIGISEYSGAGSLPNPKNDAEDISGKLNGLGFDVICKTDCTIVEMKEALEEFTEKLSKYEVAIFFFAGHGIQCKGKNFLIAKDTDATNEHRAEHSSLPLDLVLTEINSTDVQTKIVMLDACRNDPWARSWNRDFADRGLASVYAPKGTMIGFATSPGETASDGAGRNGEYTSALLAHLDDKDCPIEAMFKKVRNTVAAATSGRQTTWEHTSLSGEFYFNMNLAHLVGDYDESALADQNYDASLGSLAREILDALKSYNWYKQNPAISSLNAANVQSFSSDDMFVIGRNVYQAACGSSSNAQSFIENFRTTTASWAPARRRAVLDGLLFEIFFDGAGEFRSSMKGDYFDILYDLQRFAEYSESFEFIDTCIASSGARPIVLPGSGRSVQVSAAVEMVGGMAKLRALYVGGEDVYEPIPDPFDTLGDHAALRMKIERFERDVSHQLMVPRRNLTVTITPPISGDEIFMARNWTTNTGKRV